MSNKGRPSITKRQKERARQEQQQDKAARRAQRETERDGDTRVRSAPVDKSVLAIAVSKRQRNKEHLRYVAQQPCLVCGRTPSDPHHLLFTQPRALGNKVSDEYTVPLCRVHHRAAHKAGDELTWWQNARIDPMPIAHRLWGETHLTHSGITAGTAP